MTEQRTNFAHDRLPLGDWEWFRFKLGEEQPWEKLIQPHWDPPQTTEDADAIVLNFYREDAILPGIRLGVEYRLWKTGPAFEILYSIQNDSDTALQTPFVMIGLPGFSNHDQVSAVWTAREHRFPTAPHQNFLAEALDVGLEEYLMLRHDVYRSSHPPPVLRGGISIAEQTKEFSLEATLEMSEEYGHIWSAHTNKPLYRTSHGYVFLQDIPVGHARSVTVRYVLSNI